MSNTKRLTEFRIDSCLTVIFKGFAQSRLCPFVLLHYYPGGVLGMEAASAAWRNGGEHEKGKKQLHIQKPSVWCLQNPKPRHHLSVALKPRNPETLCLVPSNQGGPRAWQLVLVAGKVIPSLRTTGARHCWEQAGCPVCSWIPHHHQKETMGRGWYELPWQVKHGSQVGHAWCMTILWVH